MERMKNFKDEVDRLVWEYIVELEEENKNLKLENAKLKDRIITDENFEEKLDKENKKLKAELKKYKKLHKYSNWELLTYKGD